MWISLLIVKVVGMVSEYAIGLALVLGFLALAESRMPQETAA